MLLKNQHFRISWNPQELRLRNLFILTLQRMPKLKIMNLYWWRDLMKIEKEWDTRLTKQARSWPIQTNTLTLLASVRPLSPFTVPIHSPPNIPTNIPERAIGNGLELELRQTILISTMISVGIMRIIPVLGLYIKVGRYTLMANFNIWELNGTPLRRSRSLWIFRKEDCSLR